jgi:hypothetical protein
MYMRHNELSCQTLVQFRGHFVEPNAWTGEAHVPGLVTHGLRWLITNARYFSQMQTLCRTAVALVQCIAGNIFETGSDRGSH